MYIRSVKHSAGKAVFVIAMALAALLAALAISGCSQPAINGADAEDKPLTPAEYMVKMSQAVDKLSSEMAVFDEAVNQEDVSAMQARADAAFAIIDDMEAIEAPEELKDVKAKYLSGVKDMKDALNRYIDLYTEIYNSNDNNPFDYSSYNERLESIQRQYDDALNKLEEADTTASGL